MHGKVWDDDIVIFFQWLRVKDCLNNFFYIFVWKYVDAVQFMVLVVFVYCYENR